jgi:regulator of protease activity HflC (stomatin/prohibitin superfamily)
LSELESIYCVLGSFVLVIMVSLSSAIRVVPENKRLMVYRLGRYIGVKGPGLVILIPVIDSAKMMDVDEIPPDIETSYN